MQFGTCLFRQVIGIPMGTNGAPLLADFFLYSYENEFLDDMIRSGHRRLARSFNRCYKYIDDLIVLNNKKFSNYLKEIYLSQRTVEKTNKSDHLGNYLDLTFMIDSGNRLSTRFYDKRDNFDFHIVNFPILSSNIEDMHDAVHIMMILDITMRPWLTDICHKAIKIALWLEKYLINLMADIRMSLRNTTGQSRNW